MKLRYLGDKVLRNTAWRIAEERGWNTTEDAEFLALTRLQGDAFVTLDPDLAARAKGIVELCPIDAVVRPRSPRVPADAEGEATCGSGCSSTS